MRLLSCAGLALTLSCGAYEPLYQVWPTIDASDPTPGRGAGGGDGGAAGQGENTGGVAGVVGSGGSGASGASAGSGGRAGGGGSLGEPAGGAGGGSVEAGTPGAGGTGGGAGAGGTGGNRRDAGSVDAGMVEAGVRDSGMVVERTDAGPGTSTSGCSLAVSLTTATNGGRYNPRNIGAIWIANGSGRFVKTLAAWARTRIGHLTQWTSVSSAAGLNRNTVDAVTGATLSTHQVHNVTWNCKDTTGAVVPDGPYLLGFEMTDNNSTGPNRTVSFTKGPMPFQTTAPDSTTFKSISLRFTP